MGGFGKGLFLLLAMVLVLGAAGLELGSKESENSLALNLYNLPFFLVEDGKLLVLISVSLTCRLLRSLDLDLEGAIWFQYLLIWFQMAEKIHSFISYLTYC